MTDSSIIQPGSDGRLHILSPLVVCDQLPDWDQLDDVQPSADKVYLRARYVHGGLPANQNGHIFRTEQLVDAHRNLPHTYLNWLHRTKHTIGCFVASRLVDEATGAVIADAEAVGGYDSTPYVDTVAALWRFAYPDEYKAVRRAYDAGMGFVSCEAFPQQNTCPTCDATYDWKGYVSDSYCEHLNRRRAPRWLEGPVFVGGAVVVPPARPGWKEASITRIADWMHKDASAARDLFTQVAAVAPHLSQLELEAMMGVIVENTSPDLLSDPTSVIAPLWDNLAGRYAGRVDLVPPVPVAAAAAAGVLAAENLAPVELHRSMNLAHRRPQSPPTVRRMAMELASHRVGDSAKFDSLGGEVVAEWVELTADAMAAIDAEGVHPSKPSKPSAVIVVRPSVDVAADLAAVAGLPVDEIHVTMAFLGPVVDGVLEGSSFGPDEIASVIRSVVSNKAPLSATVNGQGVFNTGGGEVAVWAAVDCPGLAELHVELIDALHRVEAPHSRQHGFTAHSTVAVQPADAPVPTVPSGMAWAVDSVELWWEELEPLVIPFDQGS